MYSISKLAEKRESLIEISRVARSLRETEELDGTINYMLLNYIYNTGDATDFKTFQEWGAEGYGVRRGAKAFVAWDKPQTQRDRDGKSFKYFPVKYLFSDLQVYKMKDNNSDNELIANENNFVAEIKISYKREKKIEYRGVNDSESLADLFYKVWDEDIEYRESFYVVAMNIKNDILGYASLFKGGIDCTLVDEKVLFQLLLNANATTFAVAHNHPSGNTSPSKQDRNLTERIKKCADFFKFNFVDHIILGQDRNYYSFAEHGEM